MTYLRVAVEDSQEAKLDQYFEAACDFIKAALALPSGSILVHCQQGVSRSATVIIAYLIREHEMSVDSAIAFVRRSRWIKSNDAFKIQLEYWMRDIRIRIRKSDYK
jgi:protein-tyrosine phosphatase